MSYSRGPYSTFESLPAPDVTTLHSSRKIDFATKRYVNDDDGNPVSQPSIQQIVALKVTFEVPDAKVITPQDQEASRQAVIIALSELTRPPSPLIDRVEVVFDSVLAGQESNVVNFRDLSTGLDESVSF